MNIPCIKKNFTITKIENIPYIFDQDKILCTFERDFDKFIIKPVGGICRFNIYNHYLGDFLEIILKQVTLIFLECSLYIVNPWENYNKTIKFSLNLTINPQVIYYNLGDKLVQKFLSLYCRHHNVFTRESVQRLSYYYFPKVNDISYIPDSFRKNRSADEINKILKCLPTKLYDYQKNSVFKMIDIENKTGNNFDCSFSSLKTVMVGDKKIYYDEDEKIFGKNSKLTSKITFTSSGGILSDEMGLGKTLTTLSLVKANTIKNKKYLDIKYSNKGRILTDCSLIVCPNHLIKQWEEEIKSIGDLKVIKFLTKVNHKKYSYYDVITADILLVSQQFLMNLKHYPTIFFKTLPPYSMYQSLDRRCKDIFKEFEKIRINNNHKKINNPLLEAFFFKRIIIDEGHELFGELANRNRSLSSYLSGLIQYFSAKSYWFVSGTPFSNRMGYYNSLKFIALKYLANQKSFNFEYNLLVENAILRKITDHNDILKHFIIRHRKTDVAKQIQIAQYKETVIKVEQTETEKSLYNSYSKNSTRKTLQQLCCHPLIADSINSIVSGNKEINLDEIQDKLLAHHKNVISTYTLKLENLNPANQEYHMLKSTYTTKLSESKYILSVLEKMNKKEELETENCSICFDTLEDPVLTKCGHLFCCECLDMCLQAKKQCPMCKANLKGTEIIKINKTNIKKENLDKGNPLINKYGSKLGKLISIIRHLTSNDDNRIIVFSQWDNMLKLLSKTLSENGVGNSIVKGNVWARNSAISNFKKGVNKLGGDNKVIMLSLTNAASGTNLNEATHIFFIEPIDATLDEIKAIEGQAIGRAIRLGKTDDVKIIRIITKNTIEEEIFNKNYQENKFVDTSTIVNVEEAMKRATVELDI